MNEKAVVVGHGGEVLAVRAPTNRAHIAVVVQHLPNLTILLEFATEKTSLVVD